MGGSGRETRAAGCKHAAGIVRAIVYVRVSTEEQARHGYSLPEQKRECRRKAEELAQGRPLEVHEFEDHSSGAYIGAGLDAARQLARQTPVHYFICLEPSRFARDLMNQLVVYDELTKANCRVVFVQAHYETTPEGKLFFSISGAIAEYEKAKIRDRTVRGKLGKLRQGGIPVRLEPYGYRWNRERDVPEIDPQEAAWVRQIFLWADGQTEDGTRWGTRRIAQHLNALGIPSKRGRPWRPSRIREILRNPVYKGEAVLNRYDWTGLQPMRRLPRERRPRSARGPDGKERPAPLTPKKRPQDEWITLPVVPIVAANLWERVQHALTRHRRGPRHLHLLSGLLVCGVCGKRMFYTRGGARTHPLLACYGRYPNHRDLTSGAPRCTQPHRRAEPIEADVWNRVTRWLLDHRLYAEANDSVVESADRAGLPTEAEMLRSRLEQLQQGQARVVHLVAQGLVETETAASQLRSLAETLQSLRSRLAELEAAHKGQPSVDAVSRRADVIRQRVAGGLSALTAGERRHLIQILVSEIRLHADGTWTVTPERAL